MVNPTGYTALDLIGFTDKGTYSSSDNYVKNDLVHYSGNIWRCLIDDTTGITPAEGVNWTLFIGEPTNLVEAAIASIEQTPSTSAYTVGRRLFYNDILYEVIAAIAVGDNLIAYEDDPTNANIKVSAKVEEQIDSINNALTNVEDNLSHQNLLDNPWFTVNQRGESSYLQTSQVYTVDRWKKDGGLKVEVQSDGALKLYRIANGNNAIVQVLESSLVQELSGKQVTISVIAKKDGNAQLRLDATNVSDNYFDLTSEYKIYSATYTVTPNDNTWNVFPRILVTDYTTDAVYIKAVKLELGSVSTLAMDTAPNYQQELAKCQRYFERIGGTTYEFFATGMFQSATNVELITHVTPKRTIPTITFNGTVYIWDYNNQDANAHTSTSIGSGSNCAKDGKMYVNFSTTNGTAGNAAFGQFRDTTSYIDVSADL